MWIGKNGCDTANKTAFFVRRILAFAVGLRSFVEKNDSVSLIKIVLIIILIKEVWEISAR